MKILRQTIRQLILESNDDDIMPMLADLILSGTNKSVRQAIALGESLELIDHYDQHTQVGWKKYHGQVTIHTIIISNADLIREIKLLSQQKPGAWWVQHNFEYRPTKSNKGIIKFVTRK